MTTPVLGHIITLKDVYDVARATEMRVEVMTHTQADVVKDVAALQADVRALQSRRWPITSITVLIGLTTLALVAYATFR